MARHSQFLKCCFSDLTPVEELKISFFDLDPKLLFLEIGALVSDGQGSTNQECFAELLGLDQLTGRWGSWQ